MALHVCEGSGTPVGNVTPTNLGQHYTDTVGDTTWISNGTTDQDWVEVGAGSGGGGTSLWEERGEGITPVDNKEIGVGLPDAGRESVFGEGDSYNDDIKVITFDGSNYVDETAKIVTSGDSNYVEFPNTSVGTSIYIATNKGNGNLPFFGIKKNIILAMDLGTGNVLAEYWDGSSWIEYNFMITDSGAPYASHVKDLEVPAGSYQVRNNPFMNVDWEQTSVDGDNRFWTRFRISSAITTSFRIDHLKIHTSRTEINADGFLEFFSKARPIKTILMDYGSFNAALTSPSNRDCMVSDFLDVGYIENRFEDGTIDRSGFVKILPLDVDTSAPLKLRFKWFNHGTRLEGDVKLTLRWGYTSAGSGVFIGTGDAPTVGPNEQSLTSVVTVLDDSEDMERTMDVYLDISNIMTEISTDDCASIWITFERTGSDSEDTYGADVIVTDIELYYLSWRLGGYIDHY